MLLPRIRLIFGGIHLTGNSKKSVVIGHAGGPQPPDLGIPFLTEGAVCLGAHVGKDEFRRQLVSENVDFVLRQLV